MQSPYECRIHNVFRVRVLCLRPYTRECIRTRLAHENQARAGRVSTAEGDHAGILDAAGNHFFALF